MEHEDQEDEKPFTLREMVAALRRSSEVAAAVSVITKDSADCIESIGAYLGILDGEKSLEQEVRS